MKRGSRLSHFGMVFGSILLGLAFAACSDNDDDNQQGGGGGGGTIPPPVNTTLTGTVENKAGIALAGATVYLAPAFDVDTTPITAAGVLAGTTEPFDEPLEDLIATSGATMTKAVTDANGEFEITTVPDGRFYVFVQPAAGDSEHIPGGSLCRESLDAAALRGKSEDIMMSSSPSSGASYAGMTSCLTCHPSYSTEKQLAHRLGFKVPGQVGVLQDISEHPEIDDGLELFTETATYAGGTPVYHYDFDASRGFDKFKTSLTDPTGSGGVVSAVLWLWKDMASGAYKITIENVGNPTDPGNFAEREVKLTYGGAVYKQRYMIEWPSLNGLYPLLQYQTAGDDARYDRTRKQFRDYHLDFFWDTSGTPTIPGDDLIATPSITRNISRNCMGCHATGYTQYTDPVTSEVLCDSVEDPNGEYDIDHDGLINDLNIGCETCHGPGSEHIAAQQPRFIVSPEYISPSREVMICARCHDRQVGNGTVKNDHPLNSSDEFPRPGISRAEYLADYITRAGPAQSSFWADFEHSKSHHQHGPDMLKSKHYRNPYDLVTCSNCHDVHGGTGFEHALVADPEAPDTPLCMDCHGDFMPGTTEHTAEMLGVAHGAATATCIDCHMTKTAKTGSGRYGHLLGQPTGTSADPDMTYFENDITSHVFDVIKKDNVGVIGVVPGSAMPAPYTNRCGTCHDPSNLPWQ